MLFSTVQEASSFQPCKRRVRLSVFVHGTPNWPGLDNNDKTLVDVAKSPMNYCTKRIKINKSVAYLCLFTQHQNLLGLGTRRQDAGSYCVTRVMMRKPVCYAYTINKHSCYHYSMCMSCSCSHSIHLASAPLQCADQVRPRKLKGDSTSDPTSTVSGSSRTRNMYNALVSDDKVYR